MSVTAFSPGLIDRLGDQQAKYAQSHQNDPLGAAIVLEVIRTINEENLIARSHNVAAILKSGFENFLTVFEKVLTDKDV